MTVSELRARRRARENKVLWRTQLELCEIQNARHKEMVEEQECYRAKSHAAEIAFKNQMFSLT